VPLLEAFVPAGEAPVDVRFDEVEVAVWPGIACANAVPMPRDAAAAPPVIQIVSFRIRASLSSRRRDALSTCSRMQLSLSWQRSGDPGPGSTDISLPTDLTATSSGKVQNLQIC
jgi:hypothetical protein